MKRRKFKKLELINETLEPFSEGWEEWIENGEMVGIIIKKKVSLSKIKEIYGYDLAILDKKII